MRILYILHNTYIDGGATKSFCTMLHGLIHLGVEPLVITPDENGVYKVLSAEGINVKSIAFRPATYPKRRDIKKDTLLFLPRLLARLLFNSIAYCKIKHIARDFHPALIHSNTSVVDVGFRAAKALHIPHIFHVREYADIDFKLHFYPTQSRYRKMLKSTDTHTICITKDICKHHGLATTGRSRVIYNGICSSKDTMPQTSDGAYFLYAGRIQPQKGLHELLSAYNEYCKRMDNPLKLIVVGTAVGNAYISSQKQFIKDNGMDRYVEFHGQQDNVADYMLHATATIVPSLFEGFGRVMPEAMMCGCAVIAKDAAGSHEQMENGRLLQGDDIALSYTTTEELTQHLINMTYQGKAKVTQMREKAFLSVNTLYTKEQYVKQVSCMYNEIIQK